MHSLRFILIIIMLVVAKVSVSNSEIEVVKNFDSNRYLGLWYEIARFDYKWEKNLDNVTATYSLNENGTIRVDNKGYDRKHNKWKQSVGKAKFAGSRNEGRLKVSFFGPFYAAYNLVAIDENYRYALVMGRNSNYMWILSREPRIPESVKKQYLARAGELGAKTEKLVWVTHDPIK